MLLVVIAVFWSWIPLDGGCKLYASAALKWSL
jgi:hypothetical protein